MHQIRSLAGLVIAVLVAFVATSARAESTPGVGEQAPDFTLRTLDHQEVQLKTLLEKRPVLLVVLRGWPGYQCPICTKQVHDYVAHADQFKQLGVQVLMVYPGPADLLVEHAQEFLQDKQWPAEFTFVIDPGFAFTNQYGLRWSAPKETAYPSTFLIGADGKVRFSHVSHSHGDRIGAEAALEAASKLK